MKKKPAGKQSGKGKRPAKRPGDLPVSKAAAARTKGGLLASTSYSALQPSVTSINPISLQPIDAYQGPLPEEF
jgi:hypothetical protein